MQSTTRIATLVCGGLLLAACSGAGTTPTPATATVAPVGPTPTIMPTPTAVPTTDGIGPEHFSGDFVSLPYLVHGYTQTTVGEVVQYRGGVAAWEFTTTDPRMQGKASFTFSVDVYGAVGPEWGTLTITNSGGEWTGACSAAAWAQGNSLVLGCWLTGSGGYQGFSAYYGLANLGTGGGMMEGVIIPGSPPKL